jgi:gas vesicle protein
VFKILEEIIKDTQMAKDKKTTKKIAKKVAEILNEAKQLKESQGQKQSKPEWDQVKTSAPNKARPSKKRG